MPISWGDVRSTHASEAVQVPGPAMYILKWPEQDATAGPQDGPDIVEKTSTFLALQNHRGNVYDGHR